MQTTLTTKDTINQRCAALALRQGLAWRNSGHSPCRNPARYRGRRPQSSRCPLRRRPIPPPTRIITHRCRKNRLSQPDIITTIVQQQLCRNNNTARRLSLRLMYITAVAEMAGMYNNKIISSCLKLRSQISLLLKMKVKCLVQHTTSFLINFPSTTLCLILNVY